MTSFTCCCVFVYNKDDIANKDPTSRILRLNNVSWKDNQIPTQWDFLYKEWMALNILLLISCVFQLIFTASVMCWLACSPGVKYIQRSSQTHEYTIGNCCILRYAGTIRKNNKDCLTRRQDNMSDGSDMSTLGLLI